MIETGLSELNTGGKMKPIVVGNLNIGVGLIDTVVSNLKATIEMKPIEQILFDGFHL